MTLVIKGARKLKNTQTLGLQDPYLRAWVTGSKSKQKIKTKTYVDGGSMAVWNESNELRVLNRELDCLLIEVKNDNDFTSDTIIGRLKLPCADIPETPIEDWYSIFGDQGDVAGEVHLTLSIKENNEEVMDHRVELKKKTFVKSDMASHSFSSEEPTNQWDLAALPQNWVVHHTSTGCPYYVNEDTKITTWIDPRKIAL